MCDGTPQLRYNNNSGATAVVWSDKGGTEPGAPGGVNDGTFLSNGDTTMPQHYEWVIVTDDNVAFVDYYVDRPATVCPVALRLVEFEL